LEAVNALAQLIAAVGVIASLFSSPVRFGKTAARSALQRNDVADFKRNGLT
jgi:hypothetical protein